MPPPEKPQWFSQYAQRGQLYLPQRLASEFDEVLAKGDSDARKKFEDKYHRAMGSLFSVYSQLYTTAYAYGASEKSRATPTLALLRETARNSAIDKLIIETYKDLVRQVSGRIRVDNKEKGFSVRHVRYRDPYFKAEADVERRCREMEDLIDSPNPEVHPNGFKDVVTVLVEEMLVIDRGVVIKEGLNYKKQPLPNLWHCLAWNARLETDRGYLPIGKIVNSRLPVKVRSVDLDTGRDVWARVTDWHKHGGNQKWIRLYYEGEYKHSRVVVTPDHLVWAGDTTPRMQTAQSLKAGDTVWVYAKARPSLEQEQVILGGLLGDFHLRQRTGCRPSLSLTRTAKDAYHSYFDWQFRNFTNLALPKRERTRTHKADSLVPGTWQSLEFDTTQSPSLVQYARLCYPEGKRAISREWLDRLNALGLAIWFMDNASLTIREKHNPYFVLTICCSKIERQIVADYFRAQWNMIPHWNNPVRAKREGYVTYQLYFPVEASARLFAIFAPYLVPLEDVKGATKEWIASDIPQGTSGAVPVRLIRAEEFDAAPEGPYSSTAYDVTVEGTHTILPNGLLTSNCIPGDTLKPRLQVVLRHMAENTNNVGGGVTQDSAVQMILQRFGVDVSKAAYIQDIDNRIYGAWDKDSCAVMITNPSSEINRYGYGMSPLEQSLSFTTFLMLAFHYNQQMFMCSSGDSIITTEDGPRYVRDIVDQRAAVRVKSFDKKTGRYIWGRVTDWFKYPAPSAWIRITHDASSARRNLALRVTPQHRLWAEHDSEEKDGMEKVAASQLHVGDKLFVPSPSLTSEQKQLILGTLLGDSSLRMQKHGVTPYLCCSHGNDQLYWLNWKAKQLSNLQPKITMREHKDGKRSYTLATPSFLILRDMYRTCYKDNHKYITSDWLSQIGTLGLAAWFMDDGCLGRSRVQPPRAVIALHPCTPEEQERVMSYFTDHWNLHPHFGKSGDRSCRLVFDTRDTAALCHILAPYIRFSEDYAEVSKRWEGRDISVGSDETPYPVIITKIEEERIAPLKIRRSVAKQGWRRFCYDFQVEPEHSYLMNGVLSGNSSYPEAFLILKGAEIDPAGLESFKAQIYSECGPQGNARLPVIPAAGNDMGAELLKLRDSMTDMDFVNLIKLALALKVAAYGSSPELINFAPFGGGGSIIEKGAAGQETRIAYEKDRGYRRILDSICDFFTRNFIRYYYDDLVMVYSIQDEPTEQERIELATKELAIGLTVDEYRAQRGMKPLEEVTGIKGNFINSPFYLQWAEAQRGQAASEARKDTSQFTGSSDSSSSSAKKGDAKKGGAKPAATKKGDARNKREIKDEVEEGDLAQEKSAPQEGATNKSLLSRLWRK